MRIVNGILFVVMLLFVAVQYNDPDGPWWMLIYGVPAVWTGLAAFRPDLLSRPAARPLWTASFVLGLVGVVYYWPPVGEWWRESVWWNVEEAREGMGVMIVLAVLLVVGASMWSRRSGETLGPLRRDAGRI